MLDRSLVIEVSKPEKESSRNPVYGRLSTLEGVLTDRLDTELVNSSTWADISFPSAPVCSFDWSVHCHAISLKASGLSSYSGSVKLSNELPK